MGILIYHYRECVVHDEEELLSNTDEYLVAPRNYFSNTKSTHLVFTQLFARPSYKLQNSKHWPSESRQSITRQGRCIHCVIVIYTTYINEYKTYLHASFYSSLLPQSYVTGMPVGIQAQKNISTKAVKEQYSKGG